MVLSVPVRRFFDPADASLLLIRTGSKYQIIALSAGISSLLALHFVTSRLKKLIILSCRVDKEPYWLLYQNTLHQGSIEEL